MGEPKTWNSEHLLPAKVFPCLSVRFVVCKTRMSLSKGYDKRWIFVYVRYLKINLRFLLIKSFFVYRLSSCCVSLPKYTDTSKLQSMSSITNVTCNCNRSHNRIASIICVQFHNIVINLNECSLITCTMQRIEIPDTVPIQISCGTDTCCRGKSFLNATQWRVFQSKTYCTAKKAVRYVSNKSTGFLPYFQCLCLISILCVRLFLVYCISKWFVCWNVLSLI